MGTNSEAHGGEPLDNCVNNWKKFDLHVIESSKYRETSVKHEAQILTLEKAHVDMASDIKDIKDDIKDIRDIQWSIKVWILTSAVSSLVIICGIALWLGGDKRQIEIDSRRIEVIDTALQEHIRYDNQRFKEHSQ